MKERRKKVIKTALILCGIGAVYGLFVLIRRRGLPCMFNSLTGLECPGCGITGMIFCLLRLNFRGAWRENAGVLCLLPLMAATAARFVYVYIRRGSTRDRLVDVSVWIMIAALLAWGVVRNLIR